MTSLAGQADTTAIRAFLVADVRGYSSFANQHGDEAAASLARSFLELSAKVLVENSGEIIATRGDEVVAAFDSPRRAILAAIELQRRLLGQTRDDPDHPLPVGMGLDMGEAVIAPDGYHGNAINVAARLSSVAAAGAVLATREIVHAAQALEGLRYDQRPPARLKGITDPVHHVRIIDTAEDTMRAYAALGRTEAAPSQTARRTRRQALTAGSGVLVAATIAAVVIALFPGQAARASLPADALGILNSSGRIMNVISLPSHPSKLAGGFGSEWVTSTSTNQVFRVDWKSRSVTPINGPWSQPEGIAVGAHAVWVANSGSDQVERINLQSNTVVSSISVPAGPYGIVVFDRSVYVSDLLAATVSRIDPARNGVIERFPTGPEPTGVAGGDGSLWVADEGAGNVLRLDPRTGHQVATPIRVGNGPTSLTFGDGATWVTNSLDGTISRIDAASEQVVTTPTGAGAGGVAVGKGTVWISNEYDGTVTQLSTRTGRVLRTVHVRSAPSSVDLASGLLWVAVDGFGAEAHRGGVLKVTGRMLDEFGAKGGKQPIDPGSAYSPFLWRLLIMTNDGLVGYRRAGGVEGTAFVPDLATSLPSPTDGGRTYTFQLRHGIRYSNGKRLLASDVRYALERAFKVGGGPTGYFQTLVGGNRCAAHPSTCSLRKGIETNNQTGQVVFHLVRPDPDFLYQLALPLADPLPRGTPVKLPIGHTVPATGPYKVASYHPIPVSGRGTGKLVLVRNPFFREWSGAAQPRGYPGRIVFALGLSEKAEFKAVETGRADVMWDQPTYGQFARMQSDYPGQTHQNATDETTFFALNTRVPPFTSRAVRQAVNFAVDRSQMTGPEPNTPLGGKITCQILPSNFLAYQRYCPYTWNPSPSGRWMAPDLVRAERLVAHSGMHGTPVTVFAPGWNGRNASSRVLVRTLRELGFPARIRTIGSFGGYYGHVQDSRTRTQAAQVSWAGDYPAPSNFLNLLFTCKSFVPRSPMTNVNMSEFCNKRIDRKIQEALKAQELNSGRAISDWAQVDHAIVNQAPWVPFQHPLEVDFVSRRVGDYQYNPQWGELLDQLWVR